MAENYTNATHLPSAGTVNAVKGLWKGLIIVPALMLIFSAWVIAGFFAHGRSAGILKKRSRRDMNGGTIYKLGIVVECLSLIRFAMTLAVYIAGLDPDAHSTCQAIIYVSDVTYVAQIVAMYTFLWFRQKAFYQHPSLGGLLNNFISVLSKLSLILIVTLAVVMLVLGIYLNRYESSTVGCRFKNDQTVTQSRFFIYAALVTSSQAILVGLFVYPLHVHSKSLKGLNSKHDKKISTISDTNVDSAPRSNLDGKQRSEILMASVTSTDMPHAARRHLNNNAKIDAAAAVRSLKTNSTRENTVCGLIARTLLLACISVASDNTVMGVSSFLVVGNSPYYLMCLFFDTNITVNLTIVLLSFRRWKEILLFGEPCACCEAVTFMTGRISGSGSDTITH